MCSQLTLNSFQIHSGLHLKISNLLEKKNPSVYILNVFLNRTKMCFSLNMKRAKPNTIEYKTILDKRKVEFIRKNNLQNEENYDFMIN